MDILIKEARKITNLEIQGATNIAKFGVTILKEFAQRLKKKNLSREETFKQILKAKDIVYNSRDTEPAMRNGLRYIVNRLKEDMHNSTDFCIADRVAEYADKYIDMLKESARKIIKIGATRITEMENPGNFIIFTHCHSSITTGILKEAWRQGKRFTVINTETRPKYQGRITARELLAEGIPVKMVVDSAMRWAVKTHNIRFILVGADAITSEGTILNKIGSRLLALVAREMHVPYYVATPLLKFNPDTSYGVLEKIDMRHYTEVWSDKPENLEILNPAFETVSRRYIDALITEAGIFPATIVSHIFNVTYPFLKAEFIED